MTQTSRARVRYVGPHADGVVVVQPDGSWSAPLVPGSVYETTPDHAAQLLEQAANWEPEKKPTKKGGDE